MTERRLRAIETHYQGYRFRSRLEARWAVFFHALGWQFEYEREGFDLGAGVWYLPDFYLPGGADRPALWVEVKPDERLSDAEVEKFVRWKQRGGAELVLLVGSPWPGHYSGLLVSADPEWSGPAPLCVLVPCPCCGLPMVVVAPDPASEAALHRQDTMRRAYDQARGARFEHGEHGGRPEKPLHDVTVSSATLTSLGAAARKRPAGGSIAPGEYVFGVLPSARSGCAGGLVGLPDQTVSPALRVAFINPLRDGAPAREYNRRAREGAW